MSQRGVRRRLRLSSERTVVGWLADAVGCSGFTGSLCGGGSAANLMALAMAREAKCAANETGAQPCVVYASEEAHMSIPKAIALLGIGRQNLRLIPLDAEFQMRTDATCSRLANQANQKTDYDDVKKRHRPAASRPGYVPSRARVA